MSQIASIRQQQPLTERLSDHGDIMEHPPDQYPARLEVDYPE